jgi:branched-chain amino acid transport system ATP-binding protein
MADSTERPLLVLDDLRASYGPLEALHGISLRVGSGECVALLGANGAGKTTTLRAISGHLVTVTGTLELSQGGRATDLRGTTPDRTARLGVAHVPQGRGTFTDLTVEENLRLGAIARRDRRAGDDAAWWYEVFPRLAERRRQPAGQLSGGEQQMLAVARALMMRPRLLLLDEPSLGLAPLVVADLFAALGRVRTERGISILLVEQNANLALATADRAYVLEAGRIVLGGTAEELRSHDDVKRAYLGQ